MRVRYWQAGGHRDDVALGDLWVDEHGVVVSDPPELRDDPRRPPDGQGQLPGMEDPPPEMCPSCAWDAIDWENVIIRSLRPIERRTGERRASRA
jgi:hypothetical protein